MDTIIVGLGSMGCRRARLIKKMDESINIIGIDSNQERREKAEAELGIVTEDSIGKACEKYECEAAIISTSPLSHSSIINECLKNNLHVFTELNLVDDGYDENIELAARMKKVLFLSSTFMYRKEVEYIKGEALKHSKPISYIYHVGQYLPDWHPWEDVNDFYVSNPSTGGAREIVPYELTWITDLFGFPEEIKGYYRKTGEVGCEIDDSYTSCLDYKDMIGTLLVDVISRYPARNLIINCQNGQIQWKWDNNRIEIYNAKDGKTSYVDQAEQSHEAGYSSMIGEEMYIEEIDKFLKGTKDPACYPNTLDKDVKVLELLYAIEESDKSHC